MHLRIGELARRTNLSPDSLRHYGRLGLIAATRTPGGFREYGADAVQRVRVVQAALGVGFSLAELAEIFAIRRSGRAPCRQVRKLAGEKLVEITRQLEELARKRARLARTLARWDASLEHAPPGTPVRLLESLAEEPRGRS
jgi:DNA-binding transcriptional MerR regulator